jgi:uncharacterized OsmC-like protein
MSVEIKAEYLGELHCRLTHGPSGSVLETDAPLDNAGRGQAFSPTDLLGAALLSCALTTMAIVGAREGITLERASGRVLKDMQAQPRQISRLALEIALPAELNAMERERLQTIANTCPVARSLSLEVQVEMRFI